MKAAIVEISFTALSQLLQLPEGAAVDAASIRIDEVDVLRIRVRGLGMEVAEGQLLQKINPRCSVLDGVVRLDWSGA